MPGKWCWGFLVALYQEAHNGKETKKKRGGVYIYIYIADSGFSGSSIGKESACNAANPSSIPGSGRSLEKG